LQHTQNKEKLIASRNLLLEIEIGDF